MKFQNIPDISKFLSVVDRCEGTVELVTEEGDRLNLKSKLCQYVSLGRMFSEGMAPQIEIIASLPGDEAELLKFKEEECGFEKN